MKTILFFQRKKLPKGDEQKEGEKKRRRYFFQRKKLKVPKGTVVVISSFVFFSVLFPFFLPKVIPSAFARVSSFGFFLPEEENKRKKPKAILWFFSFLFPQRGKLLFFSSFGRNRGKRTRGYSPMGKSSFISSFGFFLLISSYGRKKPEEENKRKSPLRGVKLQEIKRKKREEKVPKGTVVVVIS
jgi:hypothetical protein